MTRIHVGLPWLSAAVLAVALANSVEAQTSFDNGNPVRLMSGFPADFLSDELGPSYPADDFMLSSPNNTISRIVWFGTAGNRRGEPIPARDFTIEIYGPGVVPTVPYPFPLYTYSGVSPTARVFGKGLLPRTIGPYVINRYSYSLPSTITLIPGETYWISIRGTYDASVSSTNWFYWCHSSYTGGNTIWKAPPYLTSFVPTVTYFPTHQGELSFKLYP